MTIIPLCSSVGTTSDILGHTPDKGCIEGGMEHVPVENDLYYMKPKPLNGCVPAFFICFCWLPAP